MRVALELTVLEVDNAGTARAVSGLRDALALRDDVELVELAHPPAGGRRVAGESVPGAVARIVRGVDRETRWFWLGLPRAVRRARADLLHLPVALGPWRAPAPLVVTFHDVLALEHPAWFARANVLQQRLAVKRLARAARRIVVPSAWTADRLVAVAGASRERIRVVPWGVDTRFTPGPVDASVLARHGIDGPYAVAVGTLQPRKGLAALADAFSGLETDHRLVVVGARGWHDSAIVERLRGRAIVTGRVPDGDLLTFLRGADALVHASEHEGFGFPPLEAMACGTPVVAMRAAAVPEIVGDAGVLAAPGELREAVARVLGDAPLRARMRKAGLARAREFTWERCAAATVAAYGEAAA
jgi:glycosyltransferase involved in cell wall biosynthesis